MPFFNAKSNNECIFVYKKINNKLITVYVL